jgi:hypothetical protein
MKKSGLLVSPFGILALPNFRVSHGEEAEHGAYSILRRDPTRMRWCLTGPRKFINSRFSVMASGNDCAILIRRSCSKTCMLLTNSMRGTSRRSRLGWPYARRRL